MTVAVIMSTYNGEKYLSEQIRSILNQTGVDVELFIRDDGSTDNTPSIVKKFTDENDNVYSCCGSNIGFRQSFMQELLKHDGYEFYSFSDQDDYWEKEKLSTACKKIAEYNKESKPILYYSNLSIADERLNIFKHTELEKRKHSLESVIMRRSIAGCTMVFNRALWEKIAEKNISDQMLRRGHDSFIISLCYSVGGIVICDSSSYIRYRQHSDNTSGSMHGPKQRIIKEWNAITTKKGQESEVAQAILNEWDEEIEQRSKRILRLVATANCSLHSRMSIILSKDFSTGILLLTIIAKIKVATGLF